MSARQPRATDRRRVRAKSARPAKPRKKRWTYEMLEALPYEECKRYEIHDGELVVLTGASTNHQRVSGNLVRVLDGHVVRLGLGEVLFAPLDVVLDRSHVFQPDIIFISAARAAVIGEKFIGGPPDLAIEIVSGTGYADRSKKRGYYEAFGVPHYWIVDPQERTLEELVLEDGRYVTAVVKGEAEVFRPKVFPKLRLPLAKIWPAK